jgi:M6 family metalloprotease-like protein
MRLPAPLWPWGTLCLAALGAALLVVRESAGAVQAGPGYPRAQVGIFEVQGLDFRAEGAWRRLARRVREERRTLLGRREFSRLNAPGRARVAVGGQYLVPVIPVTFPGVAPPFPAPSYHPLLFDPAPALGPTVRSYYAEMSRGRVDLSGDLFEWVVADSSDLYYEDGCNGIGALAPCAHGGRRLGELFLQALARSDTGQVDWGRYDNDGPDGLPNSGDDDGIVDFALFLQPEVDGACGTTNLWAHRFDLGAYTGGQGFLTRSPVRDAQGQPTAARIRVRDYTLQSAVGGPGACSGGQPMSIGIVAHETGHAFGLPDLYDTNLSSSAATQGVGEWSIMGSGAYSQPYSPSGFDGWSLAELGWVAVDTAAAEGTHVLGPVASTDTVLVLPADGTDEYFLLENRQALGTDTAQLNPACTFGTRSCAKGPGLLIWHIDQGQINLWGFRSGNRVNSGPVHGVALVQADGLNQLRQAGGRNRGDAGDPWPGASGNTTFGPLTNPAALDNQGLTVGFTLDSIRALAPGGPMAFRLTVGTPGGVILSLPLVTDQLLGRRTLSDAALTQLDQAGNQNGRFDTGDWLAYMRSLPAAGREAP